MLSGSFKKRKKGYMVWAYGQRWWHRTLKGAEKRAQDAQSWCHNVQIFDVETGKLVGGRPE